METAELVQLLRERAVPFRADAAPDDLSDLAPVAAALGDARVVLLGEQTHGDGGAFAFKARLARFLHLERGFDTLAFESDAEACARAWTTIREAPGDVVTARAAFADAVFDIWSETAQVDPLVRHLAASAGSARPLELVGFDGPDDRRPGETRSAFMKRREELMAERLRALVVADRRLVGWAHSGHLLRRIRDVEAWVTGNWGPAEKTAGEVAWEAAPEETWIVGFAACGGQAGRLGRKPYDVPRPRAGTLEAAFLETDLEAAFLDVRGGALPEPVTCRLLGHRGVEVDLARHLDGLLLFRAMTPATARVP